MIQRVPVVLLCGLAGLLSACSALQGPACGPGEQPLVNELLYFGTTKPRGTVRRIRKIGGDERQVELGVPGILAEIVLVQVVDDAVLAASDQIASLGNQDDRSSNRCDNGPPYSGPTSPPGPPFGSTGMGSPGLGSPTAIPGGSLPLES